MAVSKALKIALWVCFGLSLGCGDPGSVEVSGGPLPGENGTGPATLAVAVSVDPAVASAGQDVTVQVKVSNGGGRIAREVVVDSPKLVGSGFALLRKSPLEPSVDIAGGQSHQFSFVYQVTDPGALTFEASAHGIEELRGDVVGPVSSVTALSVVSPARLAIESISIPTQTVVGGTLEVAMTVVNTGQSVASAIVPSDVVFAGSALAARTDGPNPSTMELAPGASGTFRWTYSPTTAGTLSFKGSAAGVDGYSKAPISTSESVSNDSQVAGPSTLVPTAFTGPSTLSRGQLFDVTLTVKNTGTAAVRGVLPNPRNPTVAPTGGASATVTSAPAAQDIAPGATSNFTWTLTENGTSPGSLRFAAGLQGTEAGTNRLITASPVQSTLINVKNDGALVVADVAVPARVNPGQAFTATVIVRNLGAATLGNVKPALLDSVRTGGANATSSTAVAPVDLAPGAQSVFRFDLRENGNASGSLRLQVGASGTDAAKGISVSAPAATSGIILVQTPTALSILTLFSPASVGRGANFAVSMTVNNTGETPANNVTPSALTVVTSGGARASTNSQPAPVNIPGGGSQTFSFVFNENGTGGGTLQFSGSARGTDAGSGATVTAPAATSRFSVVQ